MPLPSFSPNVRLRDSGEEQVATRSPSPASPANVIRVRAERRAEPGDLGQPAGDHRRRRVVAEPEPDRHADGERDDVLAAPPSSTADHVGVGVGPEVRAVQARLRAVSATASSAHATTLAAGWRSAISRARLGPDTTAIRSGATPATSAITSLIRLVGPELDALHQADHDGVAGQRPAQRPGSSRSDCDGTASTTSSAPAKAYPGSWVALIAAGSSMPGR